MTQEKKSRRRKARTGRPPKLTEKVQEDICVMLRQGNTLEVAAGVAGISRATVFSWRQRGEAEPGTIYGAFLDATDRAMKAAEALHVRNIVNAAPKDWRASAFYLTHRPKSLGEPWAPTNHLRHAGADGGPVRTVGTLDATVSGVVQVMDLRNLNDSDLEDAGRLARKAAGRSGGGGGEGAA